MNVLRRLTTATALAAALTCAATSTAVAAAPADITCGNHATRDADNHYSYFGNCADHPVNIHVFSYYIPPGSTLPVSQDKGYRCVPANTDQLLGSYPNSVNAFYAGGETGPC
ncbi:hypothetical protein V5P93_006224 [Actinokineospora auranticolor]|uniref:Secreted protein n=1 Tax=Actinokineospora auranticolor TaxID=155976 RepID=A0A2S6GI34_9PSEU|nr:hypothetical protein [Actinokineospora auranticolor]PPK64821.1 hypothetical protein CLV40_11760 [Actinokineospora auranticolor]